MPQGCQEVELRNLLRAHCAASLAASYVVRAERAALTSGEPWLRDAALRRAPTRHRQLGLVLWRWKLVPGGRRGVRELCCELDDEQAPSDAQAVDARDESGHGGAAVTRDESVCRTMTATAHGFELA